MADGPFNMGPAVWGNVSCEIRSLKPSGSCNLVVLGAGGVASVAVFLIICRAFGLFSIILIVIRRSLTPIDLY